MLASSYRTVRLNTLSSAECIVSMCACQCTSAQQCDGSNLSTQPPESRPMGQWQSRSIYQWADIVEADKVHTAWLKDRRGSLKHTHAHTSSNTDPEESVQPAASREINIDLYSHSHAKYRGLLFSSVDAAGGFISSFSGSDCFTIRQVLQHVLTPGQPTLIQSQ